MFIKIDGNKFLDDRPVCLRNPYSRVILDNLEIEMPHKSRCSHYAYGLCTVKGFCNQQHYPIVLEKDLPRQVTVA